MEILLNRFKDHHPDPTDLLALLVAELRPENPDQLEDAERRLRALCHLLETRSDLRRAVREAILGLSTETRHADLYASTGILPNTGFFTELFRRIGHKLLPEALDDERLRTRLRRIFPHASDARWVTGLGETAWLELIAAIHFEETPANAALPHAAAEVLRALRIISFWIAAGGMDPELLRLDPALEQYESPFATQNAELIAYIDTYPLAWRQPAALISDDKHLRVLLDQCRQSSERIRKRAARDGTSIRLTFHLQRLQQLIDRCEALLDVLDALLHHPDSEQAPPPSCACSPTSSLPNAGATTCALTGGRTPSSSPCASPRMPASTANTTSPKRAPNTSPSPVRRPSAASSSPSWPASSCYSPRPRWRPLPALWRSASTTASVFA